MTFRHEVPRAPVVGVPSLLNRLNTQEWTPLIKQSPTTVLFLIAVFMTSAFEALPVTNSPVLIASAAVMFVATILSAALSARQSLFRFGTIVIALDFIAIALLRFATGENASIFGLLLILPLIWTASRDGRIYIVWAALGGALVIMLHLPINAITDGVPPSSSDLIRAVFSPLVYAAGASVVNEISREARRNLRISQMRELASSEELQRAAAVQRALLPKNERLIEGYELAGVCVPSKSVGGDFYDWYEIDGGLAITMGDVMGKGVGAGMVAATARAVVRGAASDPDPTIALEHMAACLNNELREESTFLTMFHARLTASDGSLEWADAGHGLTLMVRADGTHQRVQSTDLPLGILPDARWTKQRMELAPGDTLVSFSDGVLDLYDGTLAAVEQIARITRVAPSASAIAEALAAIAREQQNDDDVTVVALRREHALVPVERE